MSNKNSKSKVCVRALVNGILVSVVVNGSLLAAGNYIIERSNPFDGQKIKSYSSEMIEEDMKTLKDESPELIEYIKNSDIDEKKVYLLYSAILKNQSLKGDEKELIKNSIKYFCDNKYLDYEFVYNHLSKDFILTRNPKFKNKTISSSYNTTAYLTDKVSYIKLGKKNDLFHEMIGHGTYKGLENSNICKWMVEGYASIIDEEYSDNKNVGYTYTECTNTIRYLCEILGKDNGRECFFKIAGGQLDGYNNGRELLNSYLINIGIPAEVCEEMHDRLNNYVFSSMEQLDNEQRLELKKEIVDTLGKIYNYANDENIDVDLCNLYLNKILNSVATKTSENLYYFNQGKVKQYNKDAQDDYERYVVEYYYPENLQNNITDDNTTIYTDDFVISEDFSAITINNELYYKVNKTDLYKLDKDKMIRIITIYKDDKVITRIYKGDKEIGGSLQQTENHKQR